MIDLAEIAGEEFSDLVLSIEPCGSRVTCNPPPTNTDQDFLVLVKSDSQSVFLAVRALSSGGWLWEGSEHYQDAMGNFMSWRRGEINLIITSSPAFAARHRAATEVCKRLNLMDKGDRILVFRAVLYGSVEAGAEEIFS